MALIHAVAGDDVKNIADDQGTARRHIMRKHIELLDHVEAPDNIRIRLAPVLFVLYPLVFTSCQSVIAPPD